MSTNPHAGPRLASYLPRASDECPCLISVVLPCLNEAGTIAACVTDAWAAIVALGVAGEVIVVDNNSTDNSAALAHAAGAMVIAAPVRGYGIALRTGIAAAHGRYVVIADSDATYNLADLSAFWKRLVEGDDLVVGNRFAGGIQAGAMPYWNRRLGNPVLSTLARAVFHVPLQDFHCGIRAFNRERILALGLRCDGMEFATEMIAKAAQNCLDISQVPTALRHSNPGRRSHLRPIRDALRHVALIIVLRRIACRGTRYAVGVLAISGTEVGESCGPSPDEKGPACG